MLRKLEPKYSGLKTYPTSETQSPLIFANWESNRPASCRGVIRTKCIKTCAELLGSVTTRAFWTRSSPLCDSWKAVQRNRGGTSRRKESENWRNGHQRNHEEQQYLPEQTMVQFEIVHTIEEYYDGPRRGIANYNGKPHLYQSEWQDGEDLKPTLSC
jgi:hypothetical protein